MEHSVTAYLKRLPTETLEIFLQYQKDNQQQEYPRWIIDEASRELTLRKTAIKG